jgi:hypothetical protein
MSGRRAELVRNPALTGLAGAGVVAALHFHDPHVQGSWGYCPFLKLTGLPCPGCGGLRAVNDLTNGDVAGALSSNAMALVLIGSVGVIWLAWFGQRLQGREGPVLSARWTTAISVGLGTAFLLFGFYRMTPWGAWLRP